MTIGFNDFQTIAAAQGLSGAGTMTQGEADGLSKALEAGYQQGAGKTGGSALRVESLESSLKVVTYNSSQIRFWKKIPKSAAYSTVEEYNELSSYGANQNAFVGEGELPQATDSSYTRRTQLMKFMGTTREVTHQATLVHPAHGDVMALENQNGILWLLERIESSLFNGDSSLAFDGEAEQWDGLDSLISPASVIDLEGETFQEADIEEAANTIVENFGRPTDMFLGNRQMSDFVKTLYPRQRIALPAPVNGRVGQSVSSIDTQAGVIDFNPDVFIKQGATPPGAPTSANAPLSPITPTHALTGGTDGDHEKGAPAGATSFFYIVTANNRFGESAGSTPSVVRTISAALKAAADSVDVTITNPAAIGAFPPEYYKIYRSVAATSTTAPTSNAGYSLIAQVACADQAASGATVHDDVNLTLPFTSSAYIGELDQSVITFRQLMPLMKMDLAVLSPAFRWMILLYGAPIMFAPLKWLRFINVGVLNAR